MNLLMPGLRYFEEVARQGSLRKAEERLHVAASAINRQILKLEDELGMQLFERLPRGLRLSPAGELFLQQVRQWQRDERRLLEQIGEIKGAGCAEVRIATVESLTDQVLPNILYEFHERFPRVRSILVTGMTETILEQVLIGDADIGICINPPVTRKVRFIEQVGLEFGAVMAPDHPLAEEPTVRLRDFTPYPTILPGAEMFHGSTLEQVLARSDVHLNPVASCNRMLTIKSLVRSGLGVTFLNRLDIARELARKELVFKPLADGNIAKSQLTLCSHSEREIPLAVSVLIEQLREAMLSIEPAASEVRA